LPAIRTLVEIPINLAVISPEAIYQQIAPKVLQLLKLGMSKNSIKRQLGVAAKTLYESIDWLRASGFTVPVSENPWTKKK
jgi:biotin operon repressor